MEKIIQIAVRCSQDGDSVYGLTDFGNVVVLGSRGKWIALPTFIPDKPTQP